MRQLRGGCNKFPRSSITKRGKGGSIKETVESIIARYTDFAEIDSSTLTSFSQMPLSGATQQGLKENDLVKPTDIQRESLQYSLTGADVVGAAKTGSGKTLAFLIPVLECLWRQRWSRTVDGLGALIISPTRELAFQTFQVLNKIGARHQFSVAVLIGGTDIEFESKRIGSVNIVVCTPGRLLQHMDENSTFSCEQLQILVIDEADRILDLGFSRQMNAILENLPNNRQTLLFSATQTKNVKDLVRLALKDPLYISAHENAPQATPESLQQSYFVCSDEDKINALWSFLLNHRKKKTLIFVSCCKQARFLTEAFCHLRPGFSLMGLWGTMNQMKRLEVFKKFNNKTFGAAMIATDVASRGLDFARVDIVLQLDCPVDVDDYIHRVGRTARMDAKGEAILVLTPAQEQAMLVGLQERGIPITKISVNEKQITDISRRLQSVIAQYPGMKEFAQRSFVAYVRTIYLMRNKDIFNLDTVDLAALAKSYGLTATPRVRFLRRIGNKHQNLRANTSQKQEGEKSAEELMEMLISAAKAGKKVATVENDNDDEDVDVEVEEINLGLGTSKSDAVKKDQSDFSLSAIDSGLDEDSDDFLKISRKNVFNIFPEKIAEVLEEPKKESKKLVTRQALARKILKKGVKLGVKKIFTDDGMEIVEGKAFPTTISNDDLVGLNVDEAKRQMVQIDQDDKIAYKEKQKMWRKKKKEKQKDRMKKTQDKEGGAILDLGAERSDSDCEPDLSWLPDPDKPKKYDEEWNEVEDNSMDDYNVCDLLSISSSLTSLKARSQGKMAEPYKPAARIMSEKMEERFSKDVLYWRRVERLAVFQEPGNISSTFFSPTDSNMVASTSSVKLAIYDATICEPLVTYGRFKQAVYGARFRRDGKLLAVGDEEGKVRLFNVRKQASSSDGKKAPLRIFKAHESAVHTVVFTRSGKTLITMGDEGYIKLWDIAETKSIPLRVFDAAHSDHIRCSDASVLSDHLFVSGSYDHTAKIWNSEVEGNEALMSVDHGSPIEQVLLLPGDAFIVTAGGQFIKIWNIASGGILHHTLHHHHKTVTSLCLASKGTRLLSGGLDKRVNVFSLDSGDYRLVHSFSLPAQVLTLSISSNDKFIAVGMGNLLQISMRNEPGKLEESLKAAQAESAGLEFHKKMRSQIPVVYQQLRGGVIEKAEFAAARVPQAKLNKIDLLLRRFKHWKAVDVLFREKHYKSRPDIIVGALMQIYKRGALTVALSGRKSDTIYPILVFLMQNFFRPEYLQILIKTISIMCDIYGNENIDRKIAKTFSKLHRVVQREIEVRNKLTELRGMLDMLIQVSEMNTGKLRSNRDDIGVFGDVVVTPIPFTMDVNGRCKDNGVSNNNA
uniref:ATP-dependent RNA helicase n=1 Tax=Elaeophora elaphi TaxID=1147741 RepID=A0A0R3S4F6_9BILA